VQVVRGLHLVTVPLTPLRFTGVAGSVTFVAAAYCLAHGLVENDEINLPRTLAWAVTSTLPWVCAWEGLKRLRTHPLRLVLSPALLIAVLVACVALEYVLAAVYSSDAGSLAEILYRLLPIMLGIAVVRWLLQPAAPIVQIAADPPSPTERLRELQVERVLDVPTRRGMLAVRASDIEHVKAAGNYVELVTGDRTLLMRTTLQEMGEHLGAVGFVRVHRSLLVNALHVLATRRGPRGRRIVQLRSGTELPVGRQFSDDLGSVVPVPPP
jgi:LytTr DNA-binding domain